jgi:hypothetical protein
MNKVLQATYQDGNLVLDEKLDAALEGKKLFLILLEESQGGGEQKQPTQEEILQRIEQRRTFSPEQHHLPDTLTLLQEDRSR